MFQDILSKSRDSNDDEILTTVESVPKLKRSSKQDVSWHDEIACQKPSTIYYFTATNILLQYIFYLLFVSKASTKVVNSVVCITFLHVCFLRFLTGSAPAIGTVPEIYQGVEESQQQQQAIKQRALCRRMFMDIERQQVREVQRKREHQKRIQM